MSDRIVETPMNGVIAMTDLLLDSELDVDQREYATIIRDSDEEKFRLAGAQLAARTAHHLLATPLSVALGYTDLLTESLDLPPALREMAEEAFSSINTAAACLQSLLNIRRLVERDTGMPGCPLIDVGESVERPPSH